VARRQHPLRLRVSDDLERSRLTVFFRLLLAIPHLLWLYLWSIVAGLAGIVGWFAALFAGRLPAGLHEFQARFVRYSTHVTAYLMLLADPFPGFAGKEGGYPIDLEVDPPERQSRWITGFRLLLAVPALILVGVLQTVLEVIAFLAWFACLALGRMPEGMRNLGAFCLRYQSQTYGYLLLLSERYPSLSLPSPEPGTT
jgi:hypothetical protein